MDQRHVVLLAALLLVMPVAASAQECPIGQKRLKGGEPCIPEPMFNYLYCLHYSGGAEVEVAESSSEGNGGKTELKLKGSGSGVILKGAGEADYAQAKVSSATREFQKKLNPQLAAICQHYADLIMGASAATTPTKKAPPNGGTQKPIGVTSTPPSPPPIHLNNTTFNGFSCQTASYGGEWAQQTRERIESDLYKVYGCSAPPEASNEGDYNGNYHTPTRAEGPYPGFGDMSLVLYYDSSNRVKAEALANDLSQRYQHKFFAAKGAGHGVAHEWFAKTIFVHIREAGN